MKRNYIIGFLILIIGVGLLLSLSSDMSTYGTIETAQNSGKRMKVVGELLKSMPIQYDPEVDENRLEFYIKDEEGNESKVVYRKPKPMDFERSESIVMTGKMQGDVFEADELLLKCPSKYKDEEINVRKG